MMRGGTVAWHLGAGNVRAVHANVRAVYAFDSMPGTDLSAAKVLEAGTICVLHQHVVRVPVH